MSIGVETVPSIGTKIDPEMHETIDMAEVDAQGNGVVAAEYSRRVQVGKARASSAAE